MAATDIHGITDRDVIDAPVFEEIAGNVVRALYDCVLASYNIYFDIKFLDYELQRIGLKSLPPHFCLMYMRPMLKLGSRCTLEDACKAHKIEYPQTHVAAADSIAAAKLWNIYQQIIMDRGLRTFKDLANLTSYKFVQSFQFDPITSPIADKLRSKNRLKSRSIGTAAIKPMRIHTIRMAPAKEDTLHGYWEALKTVLSDLEVTDVEIAYLAEKKKELGLSIKEIRSLHARAFANMITQCIEDRVLDDNECQTLRQLYSCLRRLGWAPGE